MSYATFMLLTANPAWLSLSEPAREQIVAQHLRPILSRYRDSVRASYYDTEAYSARPSDLMLLEYEHPHAHADLIDALRSSALIADGYFEVDQIIVGKLAAWLEPSQVSQPTQRPRG